MRLYPPKDRDKTRKTVALKYMQLKEVRIRNQLELFEFELKWLDAYRPKMRVECMSAERPCPWALCRYNMYLDVNESGSLHYNFPGKEIWEIPPECSCVLDIAERGEMTLEQCAKILNLTRERIRQIENICAGKIRNNINVSPIILELLND
jgi:hypothetical protein